MINYIDGLSSNIKQNRYDENAFLESPSTARSEPRKERKTRREIQG